MKRIVGLCMMIVFCFSVVAQQQLFPTVAVYTACKNKPIAEFDHDLEEDRVEPGKCTLNYPKYCNAMRMAMVEDCVKCKHLSCPAGTYCDEKNRQCRKGVPKEVKEKPKPVPVKKNIKSSLEDMAQQSLVIVAASTDDAAAQYIGVSLESLGAKVTYGSDQETTVSAVQGKQVILVGGPCANKLWNQFSEETCRTWNFQKRGMIKAKQVQNAEAILLAGTTQQDTFALANVLIAEYKTNPVFGQSVYST